MSKKITTEELQQAFDLAYILHPRADVALRVTIDACDFLAAIESTQSRRRRSLNHYKAAIPSEQRLQQAVYVVSYVRELDQESSRPLMMPKYTPTRDDLIVRYVKHIIWKNSLLHCRNLAVGIGCLLYAYQPSEIAELLGFYEDNNLRKIKGRIAKYLRERFSNAGIVRPNGRSIRTMPASDSDRLLVQQALEAFTPWQSSHLPPATPERLILETLFDENNPLSEWKRKHALIDPKCAGLAHLVNEYNDFFASISIRRKLADPLEMLVLPDFGGNPSPPLERFKRRLLSENEKMLLKERHKPSGPWAHDPNTLCLFLSWLGLTEDWDEDLLAIDAARFVPDSYSGREGARLCRRGDLVKERANRELEFIGRVDEQVKVRGYRIQLGEIEAALMGHGGVREAVVVAREETDGEKRVAGYVEAAAEGDQQTTMSPASLLEYLAERVLRTDLGDPTFTELLQRVREMSLATHPRQDLPFEKEELLPERDISHTPLFQVMFALQNAPQSEVELEELWLRYEVAEKNIAQFDLVAMKEAQGTLRCAFNYNTDLFEVATIKRMMGYFKNLLEAVVAEPERCVSELRLSTASELQSPLHEWNDTECEFPRESCINELFEQQVERTPEAVALTFGDDQLTYAELNARANQLAHYLRLQGVGLESLVGIAVERSVEMLVGMLGILKAGGVYVPLDPAYPMERLTFMNKDAGLSVLLTQKHLLDALSTQRVENFTVKLKVIYLDSDGSKVAEESEENLANNATPDNLAYVIYTSGSTGIPKGVAVPHRAVVRVVCNTNYVELSSSATVAQAYNVSVDAFTFELWGALLHGQLVSICKELALSPDEFSGEIVRRGIKTMLLTTPLFNQMARGAPEAFQSLRYLSFGGEAVDLQWVRRVLGELVHVYTPTKNMTFSTYQLVERVAADAVTVPTGAPIANTQAYVLDQRLEPVPIGVAGELYIGGAGLARGYLRRPELTAEKFIPHPYSVGPGARLYRMGDQVRWLADGGIKFHGRIDRQVKTRGFHIELGEVEAALEQYRPIAKSVVVSRKARSGDHILVAYVVPEEEVELTSTEIYAFMHERLLDYMVPSAIVMIPELPLTANATTDRRALPEPELGSRDMQETEVLDRRGAFPGDSWPGAPPAVTVSARAIASGTFLAQQPETLHSSQMQYHWTPFLSYGVNRGRYNCRPQQKKNQRRVDRSNENLVQLLEQAQPLSWYNRTPPASAIHA
jgi:amino acid adenylation domain-containing protein